MKLKGEFSPLYQIQKVSRFRVYALKFGVPVALLIVVLLLLNWSSIESYFSAIELEKVEVLKQEAPKVEGATNQAKNLHFDGVDSNNQPYTLIAKEGFEFEDSHSELQDPHLTLKLNSGEVVTLSSNKAKFERSKQKIELIGNVVVTHSSGYNFKTEHAWIDLTDSSAVGHDPVTGYGPNGDIYSQAGFQLTEKGDKIKFMGRPELYIVKGAK